jgi:hypothetical protein
LIEYRDDAHGVSAATPRFCGWRYAVS